MKRVLPEAFRWSRMPVRTRLAVTSAALTAAILIVFALVIGRLAEQRLRSDFDSEVRAAAGAVAGRVTVNDLSDFGQLSVQGASDLDDFARAAGADIRIVDARGEVLAETRGAPDMGPPMEGVRVVGEVHVAAEPVAVGPGGGSLGAFVQYARLSSDIERTIGRVWLFLALGVVGGTGLAALAGLTIASRAMGPIARLTARAREIAETRDPSLRLPDPETEDEIGELAATLQEMLESLQAAKSDTEAAMRRQRSFVADASHELRTPLTSVLANLEVLEETLRRADRTDDGDVVAAALRSARRMKRIVADLLLLARADVGRPGERRAVDLAEILRAACAEAEAVLGDRILTVHAPEPVPMSGNPDELHRLVLNLVENAATHTPAGTHVRAGVRVEGGAALVAVDDDGPGIRPEIAESVFDRFVRAEGDAGGGTGLGLAIVAAVARAHAGEASLESTPGAGAHFRVRLPLEPIDQIEVLELV